MNKAKRAVYQRAYRQAHRAEKAAYNRAYRQAHRAEAAAYEQARRAERAVYCRAYAQAHRVESAAYRQAHRAEIAAYDRAWARTHPDKKADNRALRRAKQQNATVEKVSRATVYERDNGRCHICEKKVGRGWHLDHIVPLARGGEHSYRNVAVSCPGCNMAKHVKSGGQLRLM